MGTILYLQFLRATYFFSRLLISKLFWHLLSNVKYVCWNIFCGLLRISELYECLESTSSKHECIRNTYIESDFRKILTPLHCGTLSALCTFLRIILLCDKSLWWLKCTTAYNYIKLLPLPTSEWSNFQFASPILCKKTQVVILGDV